MPNNKRYTQSGTDIEEVKRQNAQGNSSQTYRTDPQKVREEIAQESGFAGQNQAGLGKTASGTDIQEVNRQNAQGYSSETFGTNPQKVREEIAQESGFAGQSFANQNQAGLGKTASSTDIQEVRRQNAQAEQAKNRNQ